MLGVVKQVKQNLSTAETRNTQNRTVLSSIKAMGSVLNYFFKETDVTEAAKDELHKVFEKLSKCGVVKQSNNGFTFVYDEEAKGVAVKDMLGSEVNFTLSGSQDSILQNPKEYGGQRGSCFSF